MGQNRGSSAAVQAREATAAPEQAGHVAAHLVKPLPSSRTTIQQPGSSRSSASNCFTYSYLEQAMTARYSSGRSWAAAAAPWRCCGDRRRSA